MDIAPVSALEGSRSLRAPVVKVWAACLGCASASMLLAWLASRGMLLSLDTPLRWAAIIVVWVLAPLSCAASSVVVIVRASRVREVRMEWAMALLASAACVLLALAGLWMVYVAYVFSRL